ncbi:MAG: hypothetical protein ACEQSR_07745 [Candidatus Methylacidiphilales bacterium]
MTLEIEINEESEIGKKLISMFVDLGIPYKKKDGLLTEQKLLIEESLADLSEGKVYDQQFVIEEFNQWLKRK